MVLLITSTPTGAVLCCWHCCCPALLTEALLKVVCTPSRPSAHTLFDASAPSGTTFHFLSHSKFRDQRDAGPESMTMHLESRFEQLRVACELELWGEAFRSVEDIQQLIALTKKTPKQPQLASYYTRLTQIFAVSDSPLYHAFAWLKLFSFSRQHARGLAQSDYQQMGTAVMLAALAILPYDRPAPGARPAGAAASDAVVAEQEKERANRMATILGFAVVGAGWESLGFGMGWSELSPPAGSATILGFAVVGVG